MPLLVSQGHQLKWTHFGELMRVLGRIAVEVLVRNVLVQLVVLLRRMAQRIAIKNILLDYVFVCDLLQSVLL